MPRFLFVLILAALLTACGARSAAPVADVLSTPLASDNWTIRFTYSGGFAGMNRTMEIDNFGQGTVTDEKTGKTAKVQLTADQLSQLRSLAVKSVYQPQTKPSVCADCFVYTLEIDDGGANPFTAQVDDVNLQDSGLSSLVEFLRNVTDNALK